MALFPRPDPIPTDLHDRELEDLRSATSQEAWDAIVSRVKEARGGLLPPDWYVRVQASGLQFAKAEQFQGLKPLEKVEDQEELKREATNIRIMEEDLFMAMLAVQTALSIRSAHMGIFAISQKEGFVFDLVIEREDEKGEKKQENQRNVGTSHYMAFITAGRQVHQQLVMLNQKTGKLQSYMDRIALIDRLRKLNQKKIIEPGQN